MYEELKKENRELRRDIQELTRRNSHLLQEIIDMEEDMEEDMADAKKQIESLDNECDERAEELDRLENSALIESDCRCFLCREKKLIESSW